MVGLRRLPKASPDWWLVILRWIAFVGMVATTWVSGAVVPALRLLPVDIAVGAVAIVNLLWMAWLRVRPRQPGVTVPFQIAGDLLLLTSILWFSGGLSNPFSSFLVFQILLAGLIAERRVAIAVTALALLTIPLLWFAPPLDLSSSKLGATFTLRIGTILALLGVGIFSGSFVILYMRRLAALRESSDRAARLAALGRVVASMCHELNTPLGTIVVAGKDLAQLGATLPPAEVSELGQTVVDQAQRASDVIGLMRGYLGPDVQSETIELGMWMPQIIEPEARRLGYRGQLHVVAPGPLPVTIMAPALRQILSNLLKNAIEATHAQKAPEIAVRANKRDGRIAIVVEDNGEGLDDSLLERLGEPFETTKAERGGTGLGLYVSTLLAEKMGAELALESRTPQGTRATLTL